MPISSTGVITAAAGLTSPDGQRSGVTRESDWAVCNDVQLGTQVRLSTANVPVGTAVTLTAPAASGTLATAPVLQYAEPLTETTVVCDATTTNLIINPAGTIAELTITIPAGSEGKTLAIAFTQIVTTLILNSTGDDVFLPDNYSDAAVGEVIRLIYRAADETWYPA